MVVESRLKTSQTEIKLVQGQSDILTNFTAQVLAAIAGTGGGKTALGYWWLHSRMEAYPGQTWGVAEPTYSLLTRVLLTSSDPERPSLIDFLKSVGHHPVYHAVDKIISTDFGKILLGSADNPDSLQGAAVKGYWLDEAGLMKFLAYQTALQRCSMLQGQVLLTTTPYNLGWLKTEVSEKADDERVVVKRWRSIDRPGFPLESYNAMQKRLPSWRFSMLYDAVFERPAGLIYGTFDERACIINRAPVDKSWEVYVGHDFGASNPAALFYAMNPGTGQLRLFAEYLPGPGRSIHEHVKQFQRITEGYNVLRRVGGSHQEDEIRQGYSAHGWHILEPKNNKVEFQILQVQGLHKLNKVEVFNDMVNYLDEKRTFSRKLDDAGQVTEDLESPEKFHLMACERYLLSDFTPETAISRGVSVTKKSNIF